MKNITREEFGTLSWAELWERFNSLQSELEALEGRKGMTEEDTKFLHWVADRFVFVYGESENADFVWKIRDIAGPIPPKVTRERTDEELTNALIAKLRSDDLTFRASANIRDLCRAAGISLTSE